METDLVMTQELPRETEWVIKIIKSCETPLQMELCENLIKNYTKKFKDDYIHHIDEAFHTKAIQTNFYQHKEVLKNEKHKAVPHHKSNNKKH